MASFRNIIAASVITSVCTLAAVSSAAAQTMRATPAAVAPVASVNQAFARCPKSVDQFADVMKQLVSAAARARTLADENPLLEPDAAYYEAELAATRKCAPTVAVLGAR